MIPFEDIKQSDNWGIYLASLGWKTKRTSGGIMIASKKLWIGDIVKVQRMRCLEEKDLLEIEEICKENITIFIKIEPTADQNEEVLKRRGYSSSTVPLSVTATRLINLQKSEELLWSEISHSCKYSINRATRENSIVEFYRNPSEETVQTFYKAFSDTARKQGFHATSFKEIMARISSFGDDSYLVLAYDADRNLASGKLFLRHKDTIVYSIGGTTRIGRGEKVGYKLLWESILYFRKLGCKVLDLEGVDDSRFPFFTRNWGGFSHFKEKFGGEVVKFPPPYVKFPRLFFRILFNLFPGTV